MDSADRQLLETLRSGSFADYLTVLFAPESLRVHIVPLLAFDLEIENISLRVSDPMPGGIRLQWWREAISGEREGEAKANPLCNALKATMEAFNLPAEGFVRYLDAREFDLYNDPMPDRETLEAYLGETESFIFRILAELYGAPDGKALADACGHAGVAYGIATAFSRLPIDISKQRVYLPADLLVASGLDGTAFPGVAAEGKADNLIPAISGFAALGLEHDRKAREAINKLDKQLRAPFLRLAKARPIFRLSERAGKSALREPVALSPLAMQYHFWKTAMMGF